MFALVDNWPDISNIELLARRPYPTVEIIGLLTPVLRLWLSWSEDWRSMMAGAINLDRSPDLQRFETCRRRAIGLYSVLTTFGLVTLFY